MAGYRFELHRDRDVTGYSGTGIVADGVEFDDGMCVLHWRGRQRSTVIFINLPSLVAVHCHDGATRLVWLDGNGGL